MWSIRKTIKAARYLRFMKKAQKSPVQFYLRHKAKLNVYSLVCSNLSQPISTRRKHYFKYVRALNFANIFIARVKFLP
jgi:hypothetical protein